MTSAPPPHPNDIRRIAALTDPVLRNLHITQGYHELAVAMNRLLPGGANWCAVATWASRQAGQSIRREDMRRTLERLLRGSPEAIEAAQELEAKGAAIRGETTESLAGAAFALRDALSPAAAFDRAADAVARGNRKVFEEIGLEIARFLAMFAAGRPDASSVAAFCATLQPGEPPDGQHYLQRAFIHYHEAMDAAGGARAELMLLANLEIGYHEQIRLQPEIREAMDAPIYDPEKLRHRLLVELFPDPVERLRLAASWLAGAADPLFAARDRLTDEARRLGRLAITETMMTLELPGGRILRLGDDFPAEYPDPLRTLTNSDLRALIAQIDPAPDRPANSGSDWGVLPFRMSLIGRLFRAYHFDLALFDAPFTTEQTTALKSG